MCPSPTKFHSNQLQMGSVVRKCRKYLRQKKSSLMKPNELPCGQRPRTVGIRGTGEGQAPSDFDRSVRYLMSTVGQIMPTNYYLPPPSLRFSDLPTALRPKEGSWWPQRSKCRGPNWIYWGYIWLQFYNFCHIGKHKSMQSLPKLT